VENHVGISNSFCGMDGEAITRAGRRCLHIPSGGHVALADLFRVVSASNTVVVSKQGVFRLILRIVFRPNEPEGYRKAKHVPPDNQQCEAHPKN
jgi:hypothetical protein